MVRTLDADPSPEVVMTQEELDEVIGKRLARQRRAYDVALQEAHQEIREARKALLTQTDFFDAVRVVIREELTNHQGGAEK